MVTTMDLGTSLIAGTTIFGILGNLAHESGKDDISTVVRAGTGLAFISYPEALAKFSVVPQLFAVLFFLMLFVLGIGTTVAFTGVISSIIKDRFPRFRDWTVAAGVTSAGFLVGIAYCTRVSSVTCTYANTLNLAWRILVTFSSTKLFSQIEHCLRFLINKTASCRIEKLLFAH